MTAPNPAIQTIQSILTSIDSDLSSIYTRVQDEYAALYPRHSSSSASSSHLNPLTILTKLDNMQTQLPSVYENLLQLHHQKAELAELCRKDLASLHTQAVAFCPIAAPNLDTASATPARDVLNNGLRARLAEAEGTRRTEVDRFYRAHARFVEGTNMIKWAKGVHGEELDLALLRVAADKNGEGTVLKETLPDNNAEEGGTNSQVVNKVVETANSGGVRKSAATNRDGRKSDGRNAVANAVEKGRVGGKRIKSEPVPVEEEAERFVPVEKSVYTRLPRKLKIKAGKFEEINAFYEQVWCVLQQCAKPIKDTVLMQKVGEKDMSRLDVLRGLAVVSSGRDGWVLASKGGKGAARKGLKR